MPKCKNNPSRSYKGTEPSPKGLGYCASGESIGKKRKGYDGKMWIVKEVKSGSGRWVKVGNSGISERKGKIYYIYFEGIYDIPYIVYIANNITNNITNNTATIYTKPNKYIQPSITTSKKYQEYVKEHYCKKVKTFTFLKKYIVHNTILLQITKNTYIHIWNNIVKFTIQDTIQKYYADIPGSYAIPLAFGTKYVYDMRTIPIIQIPISYFEDCKTNKEKEESYEIIRKNNLYRYGKKIKSVKL